MTSYEFEKAAKEKKECKKPKNYISYVEKR